MKYIKFIIAALLILTLNKANADEFIATQTFTTLTGDTIQIDTSGHPSSTIDGMTGNLSGALNVRFKITSNVAIGDLKVRALVDTYNVGNVGGFKSSATSTGDNLPVTLVLGNTNAGYLPCSNCVHDAMGVPTPCLETGDYNNCNAIAYTGTMTIDNSGILGYVDNATESYFTANIGTNITNLDIDLGTTVRAGSYDINEGWDILGTYVATVYIDNIPD